MSPVDGFSSECEGQLAGGGPYANDSDYPVGTTGAIN